MRVIFTRSGDSKIFSSLGKLFGTVREGQSGKIPAGKGQDRAGMEGPRDSVVPSLVLQLLQHPEGGKRGILGPNSELGKAVANSHQMLRGFCCLQLDLRNFFRKNSGFTGGGEADFVGFGFCLRPGNFLLDSR